MRSASWIALAAFAAPAFGQAQMRSFIENLQADLGGLNRFYRIRESDWSRNRLQTYYQGKLKELKAMDFAKLPRDDQADWLLSKRLVDNRLNEITIDGKAHSEIKPLLSFEDDLLKLIEDRQELRGANAEASAKALETIRKAVEAEQAAIGKEAKPDRTVAFRAAANIDSLTGELKEWFDYFDGYDPLFGWWCRKPYQQTDAVLKSYAKSVREKLVGIDPEDKNAIVGHPVGRESLMEDLAYEGIPYTPEELIEIAAKEYAWCEKEMKKASKELGFGEDWRKALEHVKGLHVKPGEQTELIRQQALEAIEFVEKHDLVTVPELAKETWRMQMMSPERQKVSPFFLGGETIIVSFPTDEMTHDEKLMSLRANNIHFARATVHHELIPGHHLQFFMTQRNRPYRGIFSTPFWTEGWALWFEFLLWDLDFPKTPENKIGMLFWRMHRCVRIEFSLGYHLGKLKPEECIRMLVDKVGHEPSTAEGEVRRSFGGQYAPLYQAAYMLGALQLKALSKELVDSGKMTRKQFHDAVLKENNIPIAVLREILKGGKLSKDWKPDWRFYD